MSKFTRTKPPETPQVQRSWGHKDVDPETPRQAEIARFYIAIKMMKRFFYRPWMSAPEVVGPNFERIQPDGSIIIQRRRS